MMPLETNAPLPREGAAVVFVGPNSRSSQERFEAVTYSPTNEYAGSIAARPSISETDNEQQVRLAKSAIERWGKAGPIDLYVESQSVSIELSAHFASELNDVKVQVVSKEDSITRNFPTSSGRAPLRITWLSRKR